MTIRNSARAVRAVPANERESPRAYHFCPVISAAQGCGNCERHPPKPSLHNCDVLMGIDKKDALPASQLSRAKSTDSEPSARGSF